MRKEIFASMHKIDPDVTDTATVQVTHIQKPRATLGVSGRLTAP